jgi:hypothetical protein
MENVRKFGEYAVIYTNTLCIQKEHNLGVMSMFLRFGHEQAKESFRFMNIKTTRVVYSRD